MAEASALDVEFESEGVVTSYISNTDLEYAFVTSTDGTVEGPIYVDRKCMKKSKIASLKPGMRVRCRGTHREKGPKARRIEILVQ
jgi:hypothetical protein